MPRNDEFDCNAFDYEEFSSFFPKKTRWTLRPTLALLQELKFKQKFKAIHIAGTNGKGSVAAFLDSVLRSSKTKIKTGLYTSPHLARFNERIQVNHTQVSDSELSTLWKREAPEVKNWNEKQKEKISSFEAETALALKFFEEKQCAYAVIECGLGGRLDATNALNAKNKVAIITRISLDHTRKLGGTVSKIAREKAAIIKRGCSACVAAESSGAAALSVIRARCKQQDVALIVVGASRGADVKISGVKATPHGTFFEVSGVLGSAKLRTRLLGAHQAENAALAFAAAKLLQQKNSKITDAAITKGIKTARWPGRIEIISRTPHKPLVVFDGAHNPGGASALAAALQALWPNKKWVFVFAAMKDKDYVSILKTLAPSAEAIVATSVAGNERSAAASEIAGTAKKFCENVKIEEDAVLALKQARTLAGARGSVLVCGSLYLVGELKLRNVF